MEHAILGRILCGGLLTLCSLATLYADKVTFSALSSSTRAVGGNLDGSWYPAYDQGCFFDSAVFYFEGDRLHIRAHGHQAVWGARLRATHPQGDQVEVRMIPYRLGEAGPELQILYRDHGDALEALTVRFDPSKDPQTNRQEMGMKRCESPSLAGYARSFWRPAYDPAYRFQIVDERID